VNQKGRADPSASMAALDLGEVRARGIGERLGGGGWSVESIGIGPEVPADCLGQPVGKGNDRFDLHRVTNDHGATGPKDCADRSLWQGLSGLIHE
jgi:hypothetical protein